MSSYLVTGAGRGLGLGFVRQLSQRSPEQVSVIFAAIRGPPYGSLEKLADESNGRLVILRMAVADKSSIPPAVEQVKARGIATMDNLIEVIQVNVGAAQNVTSAFLPLLKEGRQKKVLNV